MRNRIILGLVILVLGGACEMAGLGAATPTPTPMPESSAGISYEGFFQEVDRSRAVGIAIGDSNAPVTLTEYSDFSCPHCFNMYPTISRLIDEYASEGKIRVVLKPISFVNPPYSAPAAQAALCAAEQSRGWEMVDEIWDVGGKASPEAYTQDVFEERASALGLDVDIFTDCFTSPNTVTDVEAVIDEAIELGINGVPAVLVNNRAIPLAEDMYNVLVKAIEEQLGE